MSTAPNSTPSTPSGPWARFKDRFVYSPLAFAETAESIAQIHEVFRLAPGETMAGIASSGDVALSLLACDPARILAFDFNPAQTALSVLKQEAWRRLDVVPYQQFMGLATAGQGERWARWLELRPFVTAHVRHLERMKLRSGVLDSGMSAWLSRLIHLALRLNLSKDDLALAMSPTSTQAQRLALFDLFEAGWLNRFLVGPLLRHGRGLFQHFLFPPAQCAHSDYPRRALMNVTRLARPMFAAGFADNPVVGRHMTGAVPSEHVQFLYGAPIYPTIRSRLDRLSFETAPLDVALRALPARSVDAVYLSNAPDYLRKPGLESFAAAVAHAARPGARVFYLSLDEQCPFSLSSVPTPWSLDPQRSRVLMDRDPVGVYRFLGAGVVGP